jgi:hypothetical protein
MIELRRAARRGGSRARAAVGGLKYKGALSMPTPRIESRVGWYTTDALLVDVVYVSRLTGQGLGITSW